MRRRPIPASLHRARDPDLLALQGTVNPVLILSH